MVLMGLLLPGCGRGPDLTCSVVCSGTHGCPSGMSCASDNYCHDPDDTAACGAAAGEDATITFPGSDGPLARTDGTSIDGTVPDLPDAPIIGLDGATPATACPEGWTVGPLTTEFSEGQPSWASTSLIGTHTSITFDSGTVQIHLYSGGAEYADLFASDLHEGHERIFRTHLLEIPRLDFDTEALIYLVRDPNNMVGVGLSYGQIFSGLIIGGNVQQVLDAYNGETWWQVREQGGRVYLEVSGDGVSWRAIQDRPTPDYYDSVSIDLGAGTYSAVSGAGNAVFDLLLDCVRPI